MVAKTVLIADDTAYVRDRFAAALSDAGHRPILAGTVPELLACLRGAGARLDLLVIDLQLPRRQGHRPAQDDPRGRLPGADAGLQRHHRQRRAASASWPPYKVSGFINEYTTPTHILSALAPHLFPDSFNRRASPRVALSVTVSLRVDNVIASAVSANVSKGGLQLRTMTPLAGGPARCGSASGMPGGGREIEAEATVAWSDARSGHGRPVRSRSIRRRRPSSTSSSIAASSRTARPEPRRRSVGCQTGRVARSRVRDRPWISHVTRQVVPSASVRASAKLPRRIPVPGSISTRQSASAPERRRGAARRRRDDRAVERRAGPSSVIVPLTAADGDASGGLSDSVPVARSRACVSTSVVDGDAVQSDRTPRRRSGRGWTQAVTRRVPVQVPAIVGRRAHRQRRGVAAEHRRGSSCCRRRAP